MLEKLGVPCAPLLPLWRRLGVRLGVKPEEFGQLLRKIDHYEGRDDNITGIALKLLALMFVRPCEFTQAEWSQFDLDAGKWSIPFGMLKQRTQRALADSRADEPHAVS